ncbi:MFS transporter [Aliidongia dinghuensis]|uniref:MFS transporter n=1 Tax=Aliidongia dinghuensis TaxID=1867774 RepID=A0A8J3E1M7_9PROT|nr:MFS transporter [Aliidongia dinghuensis]GGF13418.1 MFS transporter [Aliidongia dinghuensis]
MLILSELKTLTPSQRNAFVASFLGWTLDAFDFFLMSFTLGAIAEDFGVQVTAVAFAITLTLACRPIGAFIFGRLADRFGRRPVLMVDILLFAVLEIGSAFSPNLIVFLVLRALFGIAMGGEWGIGASLTFESIPERTRGAVSGILQQGYACGFLLASVVNWALFELIGWRGMFVIGVVPALLVIYIRMFVEESPVWQKGEHTSARLGFFEAMRGHWKLAGYVIVLMTAFNFFSHGTQDLYPEFLRTTHQFDNAAVSLLTIVANVGAIVGGVAFGAWSERIGRRRAIILAVLLALPVLPLWAFSTTPLWVGTGAFLMQISVQGAWGIVPTHLNELSPDAVRGTFPGLMYQLGNLLAAINATFQAWLAVQFDGNYAIPLALVAGVVAIVIVILAAVGVEKKGVAFGTAAST